MSPGSVTRWIDLLKAGDHQAAQKLWERYFQQLVTLAHQRLHGAPRGMADEEDVVLSAFASFCRDTQRGHFPQLSDRNGLWRLLVTVTTHKALDLVRREQAQKRGGQRANLPEADLGQILSPDPTPEFAAQVAEEFRRLLDRLPDAALRSIALWKMEGYSNEDIAQKLGCVPRTVERRLQIVRKFLSQEELA